MFISLSSKKNLKKNPNTGTLLKLIIISFVTTISLAEITGMLYSKKTSSNLFRKMNIHVHNLSLHLKKFPDSCTEEGQDKFIVPWNREFRNDANSIHSEERKPPHHSRPRVLLYTERHGHVDRTSLWILHKLILFPGILTDQKNFFILHNLEIFLMTK